jgi:DNA-binding CsgD family transcriptional regulator
MDGRHAIGRMEAAIGTPTFPMAALQAIAEVVGTERAVWMRHSLSTGARTLLAPGISSRALETYARDYAHLNPFVPQSVNLQAGTVIRTSSAMAMRDYRRTAYFGWSSRVFGAYELACIVSRIDDSPVMISLGRLYREGDFSRGQVLALRRMAPHLRRAHFLDSRIQPTGNGQFTHLLAHAASTGACFALDRDGTLVEANAAGDLELQDGSIVMQVNRRLAFRAAAAQRAYAQALWRGQPSAAIALGAPEPSGAALLVNVSASSLPAASRPAHWLLFVPAGRQSRLRLRIEAFELEHGLTPLEARVLELLAMGRTVEEIGHELAHAIATTRSVLKALLRKTGTHRQTDLVLRVLGQEIAPLRASRAAIIEPRGHARLRDESGATPARHHAKQCQQRECSTRRRVDRRARELARELQVAVEGAVLEVCGDAVGARSRRAARRQGVVIADLDEPELDHARHRVQRAEVNHIVPECAAEERERDERRREGVAGVEQADRARARVRRTMPDVERLEVHLEAVRNGEAEAEVVRVVGRARGGRRLPAVGAEPVRGGRRSDTAATRQVERDDVQWCRTFRAHLVAGFAQQVPLRDRRSLCTARHKCAACNKCDECRADDRSTMGHACSPRNVRSDWRFIVAARATLDTVAPRLHGRDPGVTFRCPGIEQDARSGAEPPSAPS